MSTRVNRPPLCSDELIATVSTMLVQTWNAYSANNSSSCYLVARFSTADHAQDVATELAAFFEAHSAESYADMTLAMVELGIEHDFEWLNHTDTYWMSDWDGESENIRIEAAEDCVLIFHDYCLGLNGIQPYLNARGGKIDESFGNIPVAAFVRFADNTVGRNAHAKLTEYFETDTICPPWVDAISDLPDNVRRDTDSSYSWFDASLGGFCLRVDPEELDALKLYLASDAFTEHRFLLGDGPLQDRLQVLSDCKICPECQHPLKIIQIGFFDGNITNPTEQAACDRCGAMFELAALHACAGIARLGITPVDFLGHLSAGPFAVSDTRGWHQRASSLEWIQNEVPFSYCILQRASGDIVLSDYQNILRTADGVAYAPLPAPPHRPDKLSESFSGVLYASTGNNKILTYDDNNETWQTTGLPNPVRIQCFTIGTAWWIARDRDLLHSSDAGRNFSVCVRETDRVVNQLLELASPMDAFQAIGIGNDGLLLTTQDGLGWKESTISAHSLHAVIEYKDTLYICGAGGTLLVYDATHDSWEQWTLPIRDTLLCLAVTPAGLWAGGAQGLLLKID